MRMLYRFIGVFLILLFSFLQLRVDAQTVATKDTTSLESQLVKAREFAYNNGKARSRQICRQTLAHDSTYWDAAVLMGRTYIWDQKYDSARIVLTKVIAQRAGYYDAVDALIDAELLSDNFPAAIKIADIGLSFHPNDGLLLYKKARALNKSGDFQKASDILNQVLTRDPSNKDANSLLLSIKQVGM